MQPTNQEISIEKINNGDVLEFERAYLLCFRKIYRYCKNLVGDRQKAEDAAAHAMIQLWKNRATIQNWQNLERFLFMVAKNKCIDIVRQDKRLRKRHKAIGQTSGMYDPEEELVEVLKELCKEILTSPSILTQEQKELFHKRYEMGLSFKTIAEEMGARTNTIHYRWKAIVAIIKKLITESDMLLLLAFLSGNGIYF
jgi:RNA polymerase sigma-70 factor (ECF subfamily)